VIPGAKITVTNTATNSTLVVSSGAAGEFTAPNLPIGPYNLRAEKEGFKAVVVENITVNAAADVRTNVTLQIGAAQQTVEVQAGAIVLQTENAKSSVTVTNQQVDQLPLVVSGQMRSPFDLAALTPQVKDVGGDEGFILGGGQAGGYTATLDGVSENTARALQKSWVSTNAPSLEAISEFTVDTNGFKAEYGHSSGGVMTYVTKSGTNDFHGSAYEFLRNTDFDANYFFSNKAGVPRQIYKQSDFGVSGGGPVIIPKLMKGRNKTFFFAAYEGFRNRVGATATSTTIPTPEMWNGDFSKWVNAAGQVIPVYDPTSQTTLANGTVMRQQFPNNQIPKSLFDPLSSKALSVFSSNGGVLAPNTGAAPGTAAYVNNNYLITNGSTVTPFDKFSVKGDHVFSEKDRISGFYLRSRQSGLPGAAGPPTLPGNYSNFQTLTQDSDVFRMSWDHIFRATMFNHFYAGGNDWRQDNKSLQEGQAPWQSKFCLPNVPNCSDNLVILSWTNGYGTWGGSSDNGSENTIYSFNDDLTWIKGPHTIKFGGSYQLTHYNGFGHEDIAGLAGFSFTETGGPIAGNTSFTSAGGNPFASFLLGYADNGEIMTPRFIGQQWRYFAGFVQDDWRVNSKMTLNFGLRYDVQLPPEALNDQFSDFSPTTPNPAAGNIPGALIFAGNGTGRQGSRTLANGWFKGFGPHLGVAYALDDKTVMRASYAISFAEVQTVTGSTHQAGFTQIDPQSNQTNGVKPLFIFSQGFVPWTPAPFINPSFANGGTAYWWQGTEATRLPEIHNFNFSIERQVTSSFVVEAAYNGQIGTHLQAGVLDYNQLNPIYLKTLGSSLLTQPYNSPAAIAAGITAPFPGFGALWGNGATVEQALLPYPQYRNIDTWTGGGDHSGHSTYHSGMVRLEKRYSKGLSWQASYTFSKLLTNTDSFWPATSCPGASSTGYPTGNISGCTEAADFYNRGLEKSIGAYDVTHYFKSGLIYELPFGKGKSYLTHGVGGALLGDWRVSLINTYSSGTPVTVTTTVVQPLNDGRQVPYVTSYSGWQPSWSGSFDPSVDHFFVPYGSGPFPQQGPNTHYNSIGNETRYNPKLRYFPNLNENISLARSFAIHESLRIEFRAEAFNAFNRVRFGTGSNSLQSTTFGVLTSNSDILNTPRQLQLALKLYF
jgi:hypothetical protein